MDRIFEELNKKTELYTLLRDFFSPQLMKQPNVFSVGVGLKNSGGNRLNELCIIVLVRKKEGENVLKTEEIIPKILTVKKEELALSLYKNRHILSEYPEEINVMTDVVETEAPTVEIFRGATWNESCVGSGAGQDVYYGMPLFNAPSRNDWIGNCAFIAFDRNKRPVLVSNKHVLRGVTDVYNKNGKLVAKGVVESPRFDAAYALLLPGISYSNFFSQMGKTVSSLELGEGVGWHMQCFCASTGYKDYHLEWWNQQIDDGGWTDITYNRWRAFKDWTIGQTIATIAKGDSGTGIIGNNGGLNSISNVATDTLGTNCQGQTKYRYRWAVPIEDVFADLNISLQV